MGAIAGVLAHQGGWDEALLVAAPVTIFVLLLRLANRRAAAAERDELAGGHDVPPPGDR